MHVLFVSDYKKKKKKIFINCAQSSTREWDLQVELDRVKQEKEQLSKHLAAATTSATSSSNDAEQQRVIEQLTQENNQLKVSNAVLQSKVADALRSAASSPTPAAADRSSEVESLTAELAKVPS